MVSPQQLLGIFRCRIIDGLRRSDRSCVRTTVLWVDIQVLYYCYSSTDWVYANRVRSNKDRRAGVQALLYRWHYYARVRWGPHKGHGLQQYGPVTVPYVWRCSRSVNGSRPLSYMAWQLLVRFLAKVIISLSITQNRVWIVFEVWRDRPHELCDCKLEVRFPRAKPCKW